MKGTAIPLAALAVATMFLTACGDDDGRPSGSDGGSADGSAGGVSLDDVPARLADVYCDQIEACYGAFAGFLFGASDCRQTFARMLEDSLLPGWRAAAGSGGVVYHPDRMEECLAAFGALGCGIFTSRIPAACQSALQGTVPIGGTCSENVACEGDAFCEFGGSCLTGTCAAPKGAGSPCATDDGCVTGATCEEGTCTVPGGAGDPCGVTSPECGAGMLCIGVDASMGIEGSCVTIESLTTEAEGTPCDPDRGVLCEPGLSCVVTTAMTAVCTAPSPDFGTCLLGFPDPCPRGQYCNAVAGAEGDCTALPASGSPCRESPFPGANCGPGLTCASGTCVPVGRLGDSCSVDEQCYSGNCDLSSCMLPNRCL